MYRIGQEDEPLVRVDQSDQEIIFEQFNDKGTYCFVPSRTRHPSEEGYMLQEECDLANVCGINRIAHYAYKKMQRNKDIMANLHSWRLQNELDNKGKGQKR